MAGELPIEAVLHIDLLKLFFNILENPGTKLYQIVKYILCMAKDNSTTWSNHVRLLCKQYSLPDPLSLFEGVQYSKENWKDLVVSRVTVYHERILRQKASTNSNMKFFNVQLLGLSGRPHPAIHHISETRQAQKCRSHLQLLLGDFASYEVLGRQQQSDQSCRLCKAEIDSTQHILTECPATSEIRERLLPELLNTLAAVSPDCGLLNPPISKHTLTQFLLDQTSMNLSNRFRISPNHSHLYDLFSLSRDWCFAVTLSRKKQLQAKKVC